ncbi:MBL fold metallo-hydrolase [Methanocaldococcus fervens]|uniref:Beta-lactamase domain protein n=1 Tax=Methanocaldococcus fervens (strain DSM 4213 / JCM 15782 / AG86) TaxID=573064 RepID=C7P6S1_METFA|nr:MBL fold metallo-hydrolase [Methanocaldococcus fervens]ACV24253.1 beta-lactamase domain protein [Methanocaldococcus fervens AG86]
MEIIFRGAALEVGRSCIEIKTDKSKILLDCGVKLGKEIEYPILDESIRDVDKVFVSHAHLDHSGALPILFHKRIDVPIITTELSKKLIKILLKDMVKIAETESKKIPYNGHDVKETMRHTIPLSYNEKKYYKDFSYELFSAGHIPGSASILLNYHDKKTILYTGDIKLRDTRLTKGADLSYTKDDIDVLIIESTYGNSIHPDRKAVELSFIEKIKEVLFRGGVTLIPVFAVDRAQEILLILNDYNIDAPIYLDGMAVDVTKLMLNYKHMLNEAIHLEKALKNVKIIEKSEDRIRAVENLSKNGGIVVTTAGMLDGGPILYYLKLFMHDPKNALLLTGYQVRESNGRHLIETGKLFIDKNEVKPNLEICMYNFSCHAGMDELHEVIKKVNPELLIIQHGEEVQATILRNWALEHGFDAIAPKLGDKIRI